MISNYHSYSVNIINRKFFTDKGQEFEKMALINFYDSKAQLIISEEYGYIETEKIYDALDKNGTVNLDNCYVKNFSLTAFRRIKLIDKKQYIKLKGISAKDAFFDSLHTIDFSYTEFYESFVNLSNSHFAQGKLDFSFSKFEGDFDISNSVILCDHVDFSNTVFSEGEISFKNTIFKNSKKDFQYADFGEGVKSFINTDFGEGDVSFINSTFRNGRVSFKVARFGCGKVDFHFAKFGKGDISFERTEFGKGKVDFRTVEFGQGKVNFNRAVFGDGDISFEASELKNGKISFKRTIFSDGELNYELAEYEGSDLIFDRADFGKGNVSFFNARCKSLSFKSCHLDNYLDIRVYRCEFIDLSDTIVRDIIDLKPYDFKVDVDVIDFSGMRLLGRIFIDWKQNEVFKVIENQANKSNRIKAEQFRILKENFTITGQYEDEDKSYVEFKRKEMKADLYDSIKKNKINAIWEYPWYFMKFIIFDKAGKYATDPLRVMTSMIITFIIFSIIYIGILFSGIKGIVSGIGGEHAELSIVARSFYHSAITFLTIGYGDFYPYGIIRLLSGIEGFVGLFLMSYFTVAFVRKILR